MRYVDADAMRMALEQRLRNEAEARGVALQRLRKRVAFERFLARLALSPAEWVLKGAFALELRLGLQTRMTKDIRFEQFPLDVGLVEAPALAPDVIETAGSLAFADIALPPLVVIAIEQHIAEKVHAYTATYGSEGRGSTRVKDLVDLVLIALGVAQTTRSWRRVSWREPPARRWRHARDLPRTRLRSGSLPARPSTGARLAAF